MSHKNDRINRNQLLAAAFVGLLSPMIRRTPTVMVRSAGRASWIAPLAAIPVLLLLTLLLKLLFRTKQEGEGLGEIILKALGGTLGRALLMLYALWALFYAGFLLSSGGERLASTVYPYSTAELFIIVTAALALIAALGRVCVLARSAAVFRPLLMGVFIVVLVFIMPDVRSENLLPVTGSDTLPIICAALPVVNTGGVFIYLSFFERNVNGPVKALNIVPWLIAYAVISCLLCITTVGVYGAELIANTPNPFFIMTRGVSIFGTFERLEALIIAVWLLADFVLISALLLIARLCIMLVFNMKPDAVSHGSLFSMKNGRWIVWICALVAAAAALFMTPDTMSIASRFTAIAPALHAVFAFALPVTVLIAGRIRKKL